ncbi:hypothetical protein D3C81_1870460 [compost metagenome]
MRRQLGQGFSPLQRRSLYWRKQLRLTPDGDVVKTQLALAMDLGLFHMHIHAERTAVELRSAQHDQVGKIGQWRFLAQL